MNIAAWLATVGAELFLVHGLSRVVGERTGAGLLAVGRELRGRESEWILRIGQVDGVGNQRERGGLIELTAGLGIEHVALRRAVIAIAVGGKVVRVHHQIESARFTQHLLERITLLVEAAVLRAGLQALPRRGILRENGNHPAR